MSRRKRSARSTSGFNRAGIMLAIRHHAAVLLVVGLGALTIAADLLQLMSAGGYWVWLTLFSIVAVALLVLLFISPVLRKNIRGAWLFAALRRTGLVDVEHRGDREHRLPPVGIFRDADAGFVLISGILDQFLQQYREDLLDFLTSDGEVRLLLLHPQRVANSLASTWIGKREEWVQYWMTNCNEAQVALDAVIEAGLDRASGFHVRFMVDIPPYFATLVGNPAAASMYRKAFIRVQPLAVSKFVGRGSVVTFERIKGETETPFDYYSGDFLEQWNESIEDVDLIEHRRQALRI